jgi:hypothetical protein
VAILTGALIAFGLIGGRWWFFGALILAPDLSMLAYLAGPRAGSIVYNLAHSLAVVVLMIGVVALASVPWLVEAGVIWGAHIGFDRVFGFGYKYETGFRDTHFARV